MSNRDSNSDSNSDYDGDSNGSCSDDGIVFASCGSGDRPILAPQTIDSASDGDAPLKTAIRGNRRGRPQGRGRGQGQQRGQGRGGGRGQGSDSGGDLRPVANIDAPLTTAGDCLPTARNPHPPTAAGGRSLRARNPPVADSVSNCQPEPVLGRRSRRLAGVQRQYVVAELFVPSLTNMEDEDDGVEFCWRDEDGG